MAPEQTIRIVRSQDLTLVFSMAPPQEVTGWSMRFQVRDSIGGTIRITKTVGSGITISDAGRGVCQVALAKADTQALDAQDYVWELRRYDAGNEISLARGQLILEQEIA
ncbi:MAG: hypothetical protein FJ271_11855 [Planctomycetes bacterium]|nr:hypothetical protein [Planctomycetota bacterium]